MSRVEENAKLHLPNSFREDIQVQIAQAKFLEDISRSLAIIADCCLDKWQKDQVDRFMSMTQENKKLYCDYSQLDEAAVINRLKASMPRSTVDQFNDKYGRKKDGE